MIMNIRFGLAALLLLLSFFALVNRVEAQGPADDTQEAVTPENTGAQNEGSQFIDLTWLDLSYGERSLEGLDESVFDIFLPSNFIPVDTGSYVDLILSHTTPQTTEVADLTVTFNQTILDIIPLTEENADHSTVHLEIPGDLFQSGHRNRLWVRLNGGGECEVIPTTRIGAVIHEDSLLHLEFDLPDREPDLALYPVPFFEPSFLPSEVYFVLPQEPTITDISTAASISAGLGIYSSGRVKIHSVLENELTNVIRQNNHLIIIGKPDSTGLISELNLPLSLDSPLIKEDSGVLQEIVSPWNPRNLILVVTGHSDEGLLKAGDVLNRDLNFLGMKGPIAVVEKVLPPIQTSDRREIDVTFDSLGYQDGSFFGSRPQQMRVDFFMPLSWESSGEPSLFLSFNHSSAIDPETSALSVALNGVPVASTLLNAENAIDGVLEVDLPAWMLQPGRNRLEFNIEMVMGEDPCASLDNLQAWTVIRRDSFVHLPYIEQEAAFDLNLFPYPFNINANLADVSLVLPEVLSAQERDRLFQLAVTLGQQAAGDRITLRAIDAQNIDDTIRESNHLIVFGRPTNNALIRELNDDLPQPFEQNTDQLVPKIDSAILTPITARSAGLLQELNSPWNPQRAILIITGTTDEGVANALSLLLGDLPEEIEAAKPTGNLAVIEENRIHSTDTRLLEGNEPISQTPASNVQPVARSGVTPRQELANRWW